MAQYVLGNSAVTSDILCNAIELTGPKVRARDGDQPDGEAGGRRVGRPTQEAPFDHQGLKFIIDDKAEINNVEVNCRTTNLLVIISSCPYLNIWVLYHALFIKFVCYCRNMNFPFPLKVLCRAKLYTNSCNTFFHNREQ